LSLIPLLKDNLFPPLLPKRRLRAPTAILSPPPPPFPSPHLTPKGAFPFPLAIAFRSGGSRRAPFSFFLRRPACPFPSPAKPGISGTLVNCRLLSGATDFFFPPPLPQTKSRSRQTVDGPLSFPQSERTFFPFPSLPPSGGRKAT